MAAAQDQLAQSSANLATVTESSARRQASVTREFEKMEMRANPARKAIEDLNRAQATLQSGVDQNSARFERANQVLQVYVDRANKAREAQERLNAAQAASKLETQNRINDITGVSSMASRNSIGRADDIAAYGKELDRVREKFNPLFAVGQQYRRTIEEINQHLRANALSEKEAAAAREAAKTTVQNQVHALRNGATAGRLMAGEMANLSFQLNDIVTGLALGQSPFMIMAQQGGQVYQIFANSQASLKGALQEIGSRLTGLVTPARLAFGAIAAGAFTAISALSSFADAQRNVSRALAGAGGASGLSRGGINQIAEQSSSAFGLSVSEAREAAAAFAATGKLYEQSVLSATQITKQFAQAMGIDTSEAIKQLGQDFRDPVKAAVEWNQTLGFLDAKTLNYIQSLISMGDRQGAVNALIAAAVPSIAKMAEQTSGLTKAWTAATNAVSYYFDEIGKRGARIIERGTGSDLGGFTDAERLQTATRRRDQLAPVATNPDRLAELQKAGPGQAEMTIREYAEMSKEVERLTEKMRALAETTATQRFAQLSLEARDFTNSIITSIPQVERLSQGLALLNQLEVARANRGMGPNAAMESAAAAGRVLLALAMEQEGVEKRKAIIFSQNALQYKNVAASTAQTLAQMQAELPLAQAVTEAARMQAQYEADIVKWKTLGKDATDAMVLADKEREISQAKINAGAEQQLKSLQQQGELLRATSDYERDKIQFAQTYQNLLDKRVDSLLALKIATQELRNTEQQRENTKRETTERQSRSSSSGGSSTIIYGDTPDERSRNEQIAIANERERRYQQYGSGSATGAGMTSTIDTSFNNTAFGSDFVNQHNERHQQLLNDNLARMTEALNKAAEATNNNTEALSISLDPLFSQGHDYLNSLRIGYYKAATGLSGIVAGSGSGDKTPVHMMLQPGELLEVTPKDQVGRGNTSTSTVANDNRKYQSFTFIGSMSSRDRMTARQQSQGF